MVLGLQSLDFQEAPEPEEVAIPSPEISVIEADDTYGKFVIEPLKPGYGTTLGNPLRRVLYSSLHGTAVTWIKIEGILHEYATIPHVKEEASEFLMNVKSIRLRSEVDRPGKLRVEVAGRGEVCAGDIMASSEFVVVNPELHLATLDSADAKLSVELNVERGTGYVVASAEDEQPIGVLPVDAVFTPIRKVNYTVEKTRVGQRTDFERLVLELWTDGSTTPAETIQRAANILVDEFRVFAKITEDDADGQLDRQPVPNKLYIIPIERLELSARTLNCLKRARIDKVGEILERSKTDLMGIRGFGEGSHTELFGQLRRMDLLPAELDPERIAEFSEDDEQTESEEAESGPEGEAEPRAEANP
jgi:DNA-directed RNA polymerase subunit alpha